MLHSCSSRRTLRKKKNLIVWDIMHPLRAISRISDYRLSWNCVCGLQIAMFSARIVVILVMAITVFAAMGCDNVAFTDMEDNKEPLSYFDLGGLSYILPISIYAQIFHHSIPVLSEPVRDKTTLKRVYEWSFILMVSSYILLGTVLPIFFREKIDAQVGITGVYLAFGTNVALCRNSSTQSDLTLSLYSCAV